MMNFSLRLLLLLQFFSASAVLSQVGDYCEIAIVNRYERKVRLTAEIADTEEKRMTGLMYRRFLPKDTGMLFIFQKEEILNFWMKNTFIPLDIAYISGTGIINEIYYMKPLDTSVTYPSRKPAKFALEVNYGWFRNSGIAEGNRIVFNGCLGK